MTDNFGDLPTEDTIFDDMVCTACRRLLERCACSDVQVMMMKYVDVTMVVVHGDETTEHSVTVDASILCGGARFVVITDLIVAEYEVFDYDVDAKKILVYQLTPVDTRPAEMRTLADKLNPRQREK